MNKTISNIVKLFTNTITKLLNTNEEIQKAHIKAYDSTLLSLCVCVPELFHFLYGPCHIKEVSN